MRNSEQVNVWKAPCGVMWRWYLPSPPGRDVRTGQSDADAVEMNGQAPTALHRFPQELLLHALCCQFAFSSLQTPRTKFSLLTPVFFPTALQCMVSLSFLLGSSQYRNICVHRACSLKSTSLFLVRVWQYLKHRTQAVVIDLCLFLFNRLWFHLATWWWECPTKTLPVF